LSSIDPSGGAEVAVHEGALVVVEADRGVLSVAGSERVTWLNGVVTCDAASVTAERATFGLLLSKQGKIQTEFLLLAQGERLLLCVAPKTTELARAELDRMLVMEDVELTDVSTELATVTLHGPRAVELGGVEAERTGGASASLDRTGLGGAVLVVPREALGESSSRLVSAGARLSAGDDWLGVRTARGVGIFGKDFGPADNPHEAGLERRAVAWNKGCYLGQEAVFMQDARGKVKRRLVVLRGSAPGVLAEAAPVERPSGERVGDVTSAASSGGAGDHFALAKVQAPDFEPGTELVVGGVRVEVVARAFDAAGSTEAPKTR
jgi:tRNA-modifying protein YgfZ